MAVFLSPVGGAAAQFFSANGLPLAGGFIYTYLAGTNTPAATYTTTAGNIQHSNPIQLDAAGKIPGGEVWLLIGQSYKFVIKDANDVLIGTYDNIIGINDYSKLIPIIFNGVGTGSQVDYLLATAPVNENTTNVYINGVYQQKNTYSLTGLTVTFSEAPPVTSSVEISYY